MKTKAIIVACACLYLAANTYPWYSAKVFLDSYNSILIGESLIDVQTRLGRNHRVEFRPSQVNLTGQNTMLFFGASDDAFQIEIIAEAGKVVTKQVVGAKTPPEGVKMSFWWKGYLLQSVLTLFPFVAALFLAPRWRTLGPSRRVILIVVTGIPFMYAFIQLVWLGLIYVVLITRIVTGSIE